MALVLGGSCVAMLAMVCSCTWWHSGMVGASAILSGGMRWQWTVGGWMLVGL